MSHVGVILSHTWVILLGLLIRHLHHYSTTTLSESTYPLKEWLKLYVHSHSLVYYDVCQMTLVNNVYDVANQWLSTYISMTTKYSHIVQYSCHINRLHWSRNNTNLPHYCNPCECKCGRECSVNTYNQNHNRKKNAGRSNKPLSCMAFPYMSQLHVRVDFPYTPLRCIIPI